MQIWQLFIVLIIDTEMDMAITSILLFNHVIIANACLIFNITHVIMIRPNK